MATANKHADPKNDVLFLGMISKINVCSASYPKLADEFVREKADFKTKALERCQCHNSVISYYHYLFLIISDSTRTEAYHGDVIGCVDAREFKDGPSTEGNEGHEEYHGA